MMLGATLAGERIVAVGERGVILLSEQDGGFRQAESVPVSATLNSVRFVGGKTGWAAGHWGVILKTVDGGETWALQRRDLSTDQPIFSLSFLNDHDGIAVGLWSLLLVTHDGGTTWTEQVLPKTPGKKKTDLNLTSVFESGKGTLFVTAEGGKLLRSEDHGAHWTILDTGYAGTFWTGIALADGTLLIGGLRGTIYRSDDDGLSWRATKTGIRSSVTGFAQIGGGHVLATALDGFLMQSDDDGLTFTGKQREDRMALTGLVVQDHRIVLFSKQGPLQP
jgi:photosystem II stability/assembly factor-like uncharacterized protein